MKDILFGTTNPARVSQVAAALKPPGLKVRGVSLNVKETGKSASINASQKAKSYFDHFNKPVLCIDNALFLEGLPVGKQPGIHVRRREPGDKELSDSEMLKFYRSLIDKLGGKVNGYWEFAICLIAGRGLIFETSFKSPRIFVSQPSDIVQKGFPLNSWQIDPESGKYLSEMLTSDKNALWERYIGRQLCEFVKSALSL